MPTLPRCFIVLLLSRLWHRNERHASAYLPLARSSAASNSKYGQYALGSHFQRHEEDQSGAFAQFQLSAAQGLDAAQFELGRCYQFGYGMAIDDAEALRWYRLAADGGFPNAFESLAELAADVNEEIYWLERSVAAGRAVDHKLKSAQKRKDAELWFRLGLR